MRVEYSGYQGVHSVHSVFELSTLWLECVLSLLLFFEIIPCFELTLFCVR